MKARNGFGGAKGKDDISDKFNQSQSGWDIVEKEGARGVDEDEAAIPTPSSQSAGKISNARRKYRKHNSHPPTTETPLPDLELMRARPPTPNSHGPGLADDAQNNLMNDLRIIHQIATGLDIPAISEPLARVTEWVMAVRMAGSAQELEFDGVYSRDSSGGPLELPHGGGDGSGPLEQGMEFDNSVVSAGGVPGGGLGVDARAGPQMRVNESDGSFHPHPADVPATMSVDGDSDDSLRSHSSDCSALARFIRFAREFRDAERKGEAYGYDMDFSIMDELAD